MLGMTKRMTVKFKTYNLTRICRVCRLGHTIREQPSVNENMNDRIQITTDGLKDFNIIQQT